MPSKRDLYSILRISKDATFEDIKSSYRKLAMIYHPDMAVKNGLDPRTAEEEFKEINMAFQILSNPEKKRIYDIQILKSEKENFYAQTNFDQSITHDVLIESLIYPGIAEYLRIFKDFLGSFFSTSINSYSEKKAPFLNFNYNGFKNSSPFNYQPFFKNKNDAYTDHDDPALNIVYILHVSSNEALHGTRKVIYPSHLDYGVEVQIPPATSNNTEIILKGNGEKDRQRMLKGNLIIKIKTDN